MNAGPSYTAARRRSAKTRRRRAARHRGGVLTIFLIAGCGVALWLLLPKLDPGVRHLGLPLQDAAVIREQAHAKRLDPALIAGVIYVESKFDPRPSAAGAQGLMQILPSTAHFLARLSGGVRFTSSDLATPSINVAYGSYYLRYLLDRYQGNEMLALAAYNGGLANVDTWIARAQAAGHELRPRDIPFPETRAYVEDVKRAQAAYRATYRHQLGLD